MSCHMNRVLPYGIPITSDIHEKFPDDVKEAWEIFHEWWVKTFDGAHPVNLSKMPLEVSEAFEKMKDAPIPDFDGATGKDSCYIKGVLANSFSE